jgi:hypothetical protein
VDEADLITFYAPPNATREQQILIADIVSLDHRSLHVLRAGTRQREEVKRLLWNTINQGLYDGRVSLARLLYEKAERAYYYHLQTANRMKYLLGMLAGCAVAGLFGALLAALPGVLEPNLPPRLLAGLLLFAGLGSIASVLTRLSEIDLRQETSTYMLLVSGATKPVVAVVFALVVCLILDTKIIDVRFGASPEGKAGGLYLVVSFLCGFSERFAKDIISRVGPPGSDAPQLPAAGRPASEG